MYTYIYISCRLAWCNVGCSSSKKPESKKKKEFDRTYLIY